MSLPVNVWELDFFSRPLLDACCDTPLYCDPLHVPCSTLTEQRTASAWARASRKIRSVRELPCRTRISEAELRSCEAHVLEKTGHNIPLSAKDL